MATAYPPCKEFPWRDGWTTGCQPCVNPPKPAAANGVEPALR